jgi:hypothetical protein
MSVLQEHDYVVYGLLLQGCNTVGCTYAVWSACDVPSFKCVPADFRNDIMPLEDTPCCWQLRRMAVAPRPMLRSNM